MEEKSKEFVMGICTSWLAPEKQVFHGLIVDIPKIYLQNFLKFQNLIIKFREAFWMI